jgi:siroheme synthase
MYDTGSSGDDLNLRPGEIWLIEYRTTGLPMLEREALARADVVLYDRALASVLAGLLPPGSYAEPLAATAGDAAAIPPRALKLATEGWRVVYLGKPCRESRPPDHAAEALLQPYGNRRPIVRIAARAAGGSSLSGGGVQILDRAQLDADVPENEPLTFIVGPLATGAAVPSYALIANGLAG